MPLKRVKLPNDLKLNDSRQGVKRADQQKLNIVSKCARYSETMLKLLSSVQAESVNPGDIQDLITIAVA